MYKIQGSQEFSITATGTTSAKAYRRAPGNQKKYLITDVSVSSDKSDSVLTIKQDEGGTLERTLFQVQVGDGSFNKTFETPLHVEGNLDVSVEVDGTSACKANANGLIVYSDVSESSSSSSSFSSCSSSSSSFSSSSSSMSSSSSSFSSSSMSSSSSSSDSTFSSSSSSSSSFSSSSSAS